MKTTKTFFKTLLMSLMLVSCLGANAMAEGYVPEEKGMEVNLNLNSAFTWNIPSELTIEQGELADKDFYETSFDICVNSVTLKSDEKVQVVISGESGNRYNDSEKKFYMIDVSNYENKTRIYYYIRDTDSENNIGINEELLNVTAEDFALTNTPVTKTLKMNLPCDSSLRRAGTYKSIIKFQAQIVEQNI